LSSRLQCIVLDCDYRKFPSPFPAACHDALDLLGWASEQTTRWDVNRLTVGGRSAGGGLALSISSTSPSSKVVKAVVVLYPPTDFRIAKAKDLLPRDQPAPAKTFDSGMPLTKGMVKLCDDAYVLKTTNREDSKLSVILGNASDFPKTVWVATGEADILFVSFEILLFKYFVPPFIDAFSSIPSLKCLAS